LFGQLRGIYSHFWPSSQGSENIEFLNDSNFKYSYGGCTGFGNGKGFGYYIIKGLKIDLYFLRDTSLEHKIKILSDSKNVSESIKVETKVVEIETKKPLEFASVILTSGNKIIASNGTDSNGVSIVVLKPNIDSLGIKISYIGFHSVSKSIVVNQNCFVFVEMKEELTTFKNGDILSYWIIKFGRKSIFLKRRGNNSKFLKYKKTIS
jgi:hypothetical protein